MRAPGILVVAALVLLGTACGDDADDTGTGTDVTAEASPTADTGGDDDGGATAGAGEAGDHPRFDDLPESQAAYARDVCDRADSWVRGTSTPSGEELTITGNALSAGEGGPLLEQLGPDLLQIQDPAAGGMTYENLVIVCAAYEPGS